MDNLRFYHFKNRFCLTGNENFDCKEAAAKLRQNKDAVLKLIQKDFPQVAKIKRIMVGECPTSWGAKAGVNICVEYHDLDTQPLEALL